MKESYDKRTGSIIKKMRLLSDPEAVKGMARYGINPDKTLGVSIPELRIIAKEYGRDQELARRLWDTGIHEARILAGMVGEPDKLTEEIMDNWASDFDSWDVCDQVIMNLFEKTPSAYIKAVNWSSNDEEFIKRAGFVLMARLAVCDKKAGDKDFIDFFPYIIAQAKDNRNYVKKAVNWAIRQIGKRNLCLNREAIKLAEKIGKMEDKSARWISADALRELKSDLVQERLVKKGK